MEVKGKICIEVDIDDIELSGRGEMKPLVDFQEDLPYWGCEPAAAGDGPNDLQEA